MAKLKEAALAMVLTAAGGDAVAQDERPHGYGVNGERDNGAEFQLPIVKGDASRVVPVDCDLLDEAGQITPEFVKAMGVRSHFTREDYLIKIEESRTGVDISDEERVQKYVHHMQTHQHARELTLDRIEVAAKHCRDHYLEP